MAIITAQAPLPTTPNSPARQPDTVEAPALEVTEDPMSSKFAALARKEKALRAEGLKQKAERDAWMSEKTKYETDYMPRSSLKQEALAALKRGEIPYDEVTQTMLAEDTNPQIAQLQAKIAELEAGQNKFKTDAEEKQSADYKAAVNQIRTDVKAMVDAGGEFELIKEMEQHEAVVALIEETFKDEGRVMGNEEAAREVEAYLEEEAIKVAKLQKIQKKLAPAPVEKLAPQQKPQMTTLSNAQTGNGKPLSARERAIRAFKGEL